MCALSILSFTISFLLFHVGCMLHLSFIWKGHLDNISPIWHCFSHSTALIHYSRLFTFSLNTSHFGFLIFFFFFFLPFLFSFTHFPQTLTHRTPDCNTECRGGAWEYGSPNQYGCYGCRCASVCPQFDSNACARQCQRLGLPRVGVAHDGNGCTICDCGCPP